MIEQVRQILADGESVTVNLYTHPKNPNILEVFKQIGRAEELGSGVRNVFKYGKTYGKKEPIFEEGDIFKTIISVPKVYSLKVGTGKFDLKGGEVKLDVTNDGINRNDGINDRINDGIINPVSNNTRILLIGAVLLFRS